MKELVNKIENELMRSEQLCKIMDKEIGQRLQNIRMKCGMPIENFSVILGVTPEVLDLIERGEHSLPVQQLVILSNLFQVSQEYITTGSNRAIKFTDYLMGLLKNTFRM